MSTYDYVVIGAGLAGASAVWHLADRGAGVAVLERTTPGNDEGSSHGSARIFRYAYRERLYTELVVQARKGWDELERRSGRQLIAASGAVDFGETRAPAELAQVLDSAGVEHELLSASAATERWPQFSFDTEVLWHSGAGVIDAVSTVNAMLQLAEETGRMSLHTDWNVAAVDRTRNGGFVVRSDTGATVEGKKVIVTAGAWLPHLLLNLSLPSDFLDAFPRLEVRQEQAFHMPWRDRDDSGNVYPAWPTFIHKRPSMSTYGLPGGRDADFKGQKMAQFNGGPILRSALDQDGEIRPEMRQRIVAYAKEFLPGVLPEPYAETTCLFTSTASEDFLIDEADGVILVSACSGHGAKFAPLLGEFAANLATEEAGVPNEFRVALHSKGDVG